MTNSAANSASEILMTQYISHLSASAEVLKQAGSGNQAPWVESAGGWLATGMLQGSMLALKQRIFHLLPGKSAKWA